MTSPTAILPLQPRAGVGLKPAHYRTILEHSPAIGFFEVHAENYMGAGGPPHRYLTAIRERYPLSLHGVGLSIGAARPLDRRHLRRLRMLLDRYQPALFSEHLAWSSHGSAFLDDLLPLPYTNETLSRVVRHIDQAQEALGRRLLLENPSTYIAFAESAYTEWDFIAEIVRRSGCALLLDVNNLHISCTNQRWDPAQYLAHYPLAHVREVHLAGHRRMCDDRGRPLLIDTHDRPVASRVWHLFQQVIDRLGPTPTLIEWDARVPAWTELALQAQRADTILHAATPRAGEARREPVPRGSAVTTVAGAPTLGQRQREFALALLEIERPVPQGLQDPDGRRCPRRFGVYRNNVAMGLIEALQASYPAVTRLVGERFFRAMARAFALLHPPRSPLMWEYGSTFPRFVAGFTPAASLRYLADVARIERSWLEAYHAPEAVPLDPHSLARIPDERVGALRLALHPSVRLVRSRYPAFTIWRMNVYSGGGESQPIRLDAGGETILVARLGCEVQAQALPSKCAALLQALVSGQTLAVAARAAHVVPVELAGYLTDWLNSGVFQGFSLTAPGAPRRCATAKRKEPLNDARV